MRSELRRRGVFYRDTQSGLAGRPLSWYPPDHTSLKSILLHWRRPWAVRSPFPALWHGDLLQAVGADCSDPGLSLPKSRWHSPSLCAYLAIAMTGCMTERARRMVECDSVAIQNTGACGLQYELIKTNTRSSRDSIKVQPPSYVSRIFESSSVLGVGGPLVALTQGYNCAPPKLPSLGEDPKLTSSHRHHYKSSDCQPFCLFITVEKPNS